MVQPRNVGTNPGANASFSVLAYSPSPVHYQWFKDGQELAGATNASLLLSNVQPPMAGGYSVVVSDEHGPVSSVVATLSVLVSPTIVQNPISQAVVAGARVVLSVTVTNTATQPLTSIWRRNGSTFLTNTVNGYTAFLVITNAQPQFSNYLVVVSNPARPSGLVSTPALLTFLADSDGDGLPDDWEATYFQQNTAAEPEADPDGDSMSNRAEYIAGTDPTDPSSYLRLDGTTAPPEVTVSFQARPQRTYTVEYTDDLSTGVWRKLSDFGAQSAARVESFQDRNYATNRFYRLLTPRPP